MLIILACACGLVRSAACSILGNSMSSVNTGRPFASLTASTLGSGCPTTSVVSVVVIVEISTRGSVNTFPEDCNESGTSGIFGSSVR